MLTKKVAFRSAALLAFSAMVAFAAGAARFAVEPPFNDALLNAAQAVARQSPDAESSVRNVLSRSPESPEGVWLLGNLYAGRGDQLGAYVCFRKIPNSHPSWAKARLIEGDQLFELGDATAAGEAWTLVLRDPTLGLDAEGRLLALYGLQLRRDEWSRSLWKMIGSGRTSLRELVQTIILEHVVWRGEGIVETLQKFVAVNPDDVFSRTSLMQHLLATGRSIEAKDELERLLKVSPMTMQHGLAALAYAVAEADPIAVEPFKAAGNEEWRQKLHESPSWKRGLGELELLRGAPAKAADLLSEAALQAPFHPTGRQQLSLALRLLGRTEDADLHAAAANILARLDRNCHSMQSAGKWTPDEVLRVARDAAAVGMIQEAKAWVRFANEHQPSDPRWHDFLKRLESEPPTGRNSPPKKFLDPKRELQRW